MFLINWLNNELLGERGVFGGGSPTTSLIEYIIISTISNTQNFGNLSIARYNLASCSGN